MRVAEQLGFVFRRQNGSHAIYVRGSDQARVLIPMHGRRFQAQDIACNHSDMKISVEEFTKML